MTEESPSPLRALTEALDVAVNHAKQARYGDLTEAAEGLETQVQDWARRGLGDSVRGEQPADLRLAGRELRQRAASLSAILHHAASVYAGLLQVRSSEARSYGRDGSCEAASGAHLQEEA